MPKKILVVDDDPNLVRVLESRLRTKPYDVVTAYDGKTCLMLAQKAHPDLIILDVIMPQMDGFEVLEALRRHPQTKGIPVIMLTQKTGSGAMMDAQLSGCTDYLCKPFKYEELLKLLGRYI